MIRSFKRTSDHQAITKRSPSGDHRLPCSSVVEHQSSNLRVVGSIPIRVAYDINVWFHALQKCLRLVEKRMAEASPVEVRPVEPVQPTQPAQPTKEGCIVRILKDNPNLINNQIINDFINGPDFTEDRIVEIVRDYDNLVLTVENNQEMSIDQKIALKTIYTWVKTLYEDKESKLGFKNPLSGVIKGSKRIASSLGKGLSGLGKGIKGKVGIDIPVNTSQIHLGGKRKTRKANRKSRKTRKYRK